MWLRKVLVFFLLIIFSCPCFAQQVLKTDLFPYLEAYLEGMPGSGGDDYRPISMDDQVNLQQTVKRLMDGEYEKAQNSADSLGFEIVALEGKKTLYALREKRPQSKYWGQLIINPDPASSLVIQAPHPKYDSNTGLQAGFAFDNTNSYALVVSGTHRCNAIAQSSCDGTTSACGFSSRYKTSDQAHNVDSWMQAITEILSNEDSTLVFMQLHGFAKGSNDPDLILSYGSRETPEKDWLSEMKTAYAQVDPVLEFQLGHINTDWTRLLAFTNVQGRLLNSSTEPCQVEASQNSGRFLHVEQALPGLREEEADWTKLIHVIRVVFEGETITSISKRSPRLMIEPNPATDELRIRLSGKSRLAKGTFLSLGGKAIRDIDFGERGITNFDLRHIPAGVYILRIEMERGILTRKIIKNDQQ